MRALLYVFSGTGNTLFAARAVAEELERLGYETELARITRPPEDIPDPAGFDLTGLGYPIHAFNAPQAVQQYARRIPAVRGPEPKPLFLFKTSGEPFSPNGASSCALRRILTKKGFRVLSDTHLLMPYNIMFRYPDGLAKQMALHTRDMAALIARRAAAGEADELRYPLWQRLWAGAFRLQWFGAWILGPFLRVRRDRCILCGVCVRNCPAHNIRIRNGRVRFGMRCTMCMSCSMRCPRDAVRPGFLNGWRVNPTYDFPRLLADPSLPGEYITENTRYFRLFLPYYRRTEALLEARGIRPPRAKP